MVSYRTARLVCAFAQAANALASVGAQDPQDRPALEAAYRVALDDLTSYIDELENPVIAVPARTVEQRVERAMGSLGVGSFDNRQRDALRDAFTELLSDG